MPPIPDALRRKAAAIAAACALAVPAEGLRQYAYYDPPGILTVCRGHTGSDVQNGRKYALSECDKFLTDDMRKAIETVERCQPGLPVEMLAAFGDATFNIGGRIVCGPNSTAARFLTARNFVAACNELLRWNKAVVLGVSVALPGLTTRRGKERELCMQGATP